MLIELLLQGYLADEYNATAYAVNVYVKPGSMSGRLSRLTLQEVKGQSKGCPSIFVKLLDPASKRSSKKKTTSKKVSSSAHNLDSDEEEIVSTKASSSRSNGNHSKKKLKASQSPWTNRVDVYDDLEEDDEEEAKEEGEEEEEPPWEADASSSSFSNKFNPIQLDSD